MAGFDSTDDTLNRVLWLFSLFSLISAYLFKPSWEKYLNPIILIILIAVFLFFLIQKKSGFFYSVLEQ